MKKIIFCIILMISLILFYCYPLLGDASFKEIWKGRSKDSLDKFVTIDLNKNGIKEIVVREYKVFEYKILKIYEWDKNIFVAKWQTPKYKNGIDFQYYTFEDFLLVEIYDSKSTKSNKITPYTLNYKEGIYTFTRFEETRMPFWQSEKYITSGSFKKRDFSDVIVTTNVITYGMKPEGFLYLREAWPPYKLLWTSTFRIFNYGAVPLFGDFDKDKKMEMLIILHGETKGYWINQTEKGLIVKEIKSHRETPHYTLYDLFPLYPSNPEKYLKVGCTTSKNFYEIIFIDPSLPFSYGGLFKAKWTKDRFEFQEILFHIVKRVIGYKNLNLADIDNDGLDEIIVSEIKGDIVETEEEPYITNQRDVVQVIKWDGKEYKKIWTSKPLGAITQILVDDVTGDGKKEIIVGNDKGEIHIFGQK